MFSPLALVLILFVQNKELECAKLGRHNASLAECWFTKQPKRQLSVAPPSTSIANFFASLLRNIAFM
jgi:hypothetical protein